MLSTAAIIKPHASLSHFRALHFSPSTPGPPLKPPLELHLPPPMTPLLPPGSTLFLPASVPQGFAKSLSKSDQKESQHCPTRLRSLALPRYPQRELLGPSVGGLVACPVTLFLETPAVESVVATLAVAVAQACKGEWVTGLPPQAAQSAAQLAPVCPQ